MNQKGFTIPELLVTLAIFSILSGFVYLNLYQSQHKSSIRASLITLVADIRQQQLKTMDGDTQGTNTLVNYGIYFQTNSYTLFHSASYVSSNTSNFTINLPANVQFINNLFSGSTLLFDKGTGEMLNFSNTTNAITIKDTSSNQTATLTINRYGVITTVN